MKIPKIAIIDDGVNPQYVNPKQDFIAYEVINNKVKQASKVVGITHATSCYQVFDSHATVKYKLISVKILSEQGTCTIKDAQVALNWCATQDIDIINMSMGTRQYHDFKHMAKAINGLPQNTIVVAACSNQNTITFPACLPNVLGVRHCNIKKLQNKFTYINNPYDQIEIMTYGGKNSNSMAAPLISAKICEYLAKNEKNNIKIIKQKLMEESIDITERLNYSFYKNLFPEWDYDIDVPVVLIPDNNKKAINKIKSLISAFINEDYRAIGLTIFNETSVCDLIFSITSRKDIKLYYNFTQPDIIFLHTNLLYLQPDATISSRKYDDKICLDINEPTSNLLLQIKEIFI